MVDIYLEGAEVHAEAPEEEQEAALILNKCRKTNRCYHYGRYYIFHLLSHSDIIKPS